MQNGLAGPAAQEVWQAAEYLASCFLQEPDLRSAFSSRLQEVLMERYQDHWYPDEPHRGCAYRAITYAPPIIDPLLLRAAELAGVHDAAFSKQHQTEPEILLWVNPGEVKQLRGKGIQYIWTDGSAKENPYSKLRMKIEPTKVNVRYDNCSEQPTGSPCSSHPLDGSCPGTPFISESPASSMIPMMAPLPPQANAPVAAGSNNLGANMGAMRPDGGMQQQPPQPPRSSPMRGSVMLPYVACS
mmetsp:Transcript_65712/g.109176  ORF Transcript_65712/g.109176 Transcript_65712/m.109176 type:complete len:242 (-) Transcript_65712:235-960(-)|eukprot:CAMPEP_0119309602 /NCGR_PEP_ID=MMETSP1333-20130426/15858_1 /TAXON_ID=418940 /ORGANISM="Scyphosphaera apsteinii, Strain RCC1455" /LENGTH=241 /DNA_ID=CAMNT_0007313599 /DNA_START=96 /DNA_END=821 /DNA_ORIENTATION=+